MSVRAGSAGRQTLTSFNPPSAIRYSPSWNTAIMGPPKEFTITVSDRAFVLTEDQIHRDAPNYFTGLFDGSFKEAREGAQELKLHRDPYLFTFIHMHLCGYEVLLRFVHSSELCPDGTHPEVFPDGISHRHPPLYDIQPTIPPAPLRALSAIKSLCQARS